MSNVAVLTNAFREKPRIIECIRQFKPFDLEHIVLCPQQSWNGGLQNDDTHALATREGASTIVGHWASEAAQYNWGLSHFRDKSWVIICDADERYEEKDIKELLEVLDDISEKFNAIRTDEWEVYWWSPEYVIRPEQTYYPLIAVRPNQAVFTHARHLEHEESVVVPIPMHHFSYVRTDEEMWDKINTFSHAPEFDPKEWYENIWLKWTPDSRNLHPVVPSQFEEAIWKPAPPQLRL